MKVELESLEQKVDQVLGVCAGLRDENRELRAKVSALEADKRTLSEKVETARVRLEALMTQLPEQ